ncbi:hypothetical protein GC167_04425 [bacterium]|nr:hypothetical protein [bacterium]
MDVWAQTPDPSCLFEDWMRVSTPSGLKMRSAPGLKSAVRTVVPNDSTLILCPAFYGDLTVESVSGHWRWAHYREFQGYVFDGFLKPVQASTVSDTLRIAPPPSPSEISREPTPAPVPEKPLEIKVLGAVYNHCGPLDDIDPGWYWFGVYAEEIQGIEQWTFRPIELQISLSPGTKPGRPEFDLLPKNADPPQLMIGFSRSVGLPDPVEPNRGTVWPVSLMPGTSVVLPASNPGLNSLNLQLGALGTVEQLGDCPRVSGYRLVVEQSGIRQVLEEFAGFDDRCGVPELFWYGDLNRDAIADAVLLEKAPNRVRFVLMLSQTNPAALWRRASSWEYQNCP